MFSSFTDVVRSKNSTELPEVALRHSLYTRKPSVATFTSYANSLIDTYPDQDELINDIAGAGLLLGSNNIQVLQEQLIDLERYLFDTK